MDHWADYVIFSLFILISLGIGLYHALTGGKQRTTEEFIMANRQLQLIPTTMSILMSYMSAILIVGVPAEIYSYGLMVAPMTILGFWVALLITERLCIPWLYPLKLTSVNRYFEMRFGDGELRAFASIIGIISAVMYMGTCMFAPAVALQTATGFPSVASIPIMAIVCIVYTSLGGMRAVIWTDVFQCIVMLGGMFAVLFKGMALVHGGGRAFELLDDNSRFNIIDFSVDPRVRQTVWGYSIGFGFQWACVFGLQQASVQRYSALPTLRKARLSALLNMVGIGAFIMISALNGVAVLAYYASIPCDPMQSGQITHANQILPMFVREIFSDAHGFSGLFLATLYSGALSSVSSSLSGVAANAWDDILRTRLKPVSEYRAAVINKILVALFGLLATGVSFMAAGMAGTVTQVALVFFGACTGPLLGIYILSGVRAFKLVRSRGVLAGGILGLAVCLWVAISAGFVEGKYPLKPPLQTDGCTNITLNIQVNSSEPIIDEILGINKLYSMSYLWYAPFGAIFTIAAGLLISVVINCSCKEHTRAHLDDCLFIPFGDILRCREKRYEPASTLQETIKEEEMSTLSIR